MIDEIEYGKIVFEGESFKDVKIINKVPQEWTWKKDHKVTIEDINDMLDIIDVLVIGTGTEGKVEVEKEVLDACDKREIHVHIEKSDSAMRLYNEIEGHHVVGAIIHSTC